MDEAAETNSLSNNIPTECPTIRRADYGTTVYSNMALPDFDFILYDVQTMSIVIYGRLWYCFVFLYCIYVVIWLCIVLNFAI